MAPFSRQKKDTKEKMISGAGKFVF